MKKYTLIIITLLFSLNLSAQWIGAVGQWQTNTDTDGSKLLRFNGTNLKYNVSDTLAKLSSKINLTTNGSSGPATFVNDTLNIPEYAVGGGGSVDSVALALGTTGTDINSSVTTPTTTPIINLNIPTASEANRGALNSTDWITFNNKQSTISFAVIGSTPNANAASISGGVITFQPASATFGGLITTLAQTFAGNKTFNGTVQSINFGSGIAPNANSRYTASAGTSTIGQFLFTPGVDYTGSVNGMTSYTSTGSRLKMYRSASLDDFIFSGNNTVLAGSGNRIVIADTLGVPTATINYRPYINNVSSASTLTIDDSGVYTFTGTTATYTLPPVSGNTLKEFVVINEGSGNLVINSNTGGNDILDGNTSLNTVTIAAGDNPYTFINNSRKYVIK